MFVTPAARRARNKILTRRAETFGHVAEFGQILERSDANYSGGKFAAASTRVGLSSFAYQIGRIPENSENWLVHLVLFLFLED